MARGKRQTVDSLGSEAECGRWPFSLASARFRGFPMHHGRAAAIPEPMRMQADPSRRCLPERRERFAAFIALVGLFALGACTGTDIGTAKDPGTPVTPQWLIGGWVLRGQSCDGDAGVVYRADGSWIAEGISGAWRVRGRDLILKVTSRDGAEGPSRFVDRVEIIDRNTFRARRDRGPTRVFTRCHAVAGPS